MSECGTCRAPVRWVLSTHGNKMPINAEPVADGNIILTEHGFAQVLGPLELMMLPPGTKRYVAHFVTCPNAAQHRKGSSR